MKKRHNIVKYIGGLTLLACCYSTLASDVTTTPNEGNTSLSDSRVQSQYLPIEKSNFGDSISYTFIDRTSVKKHPYNNLIRTYTRVINYGPPIVVQDQDGKDIAYHSVVSHEYVNCDLQEFAKGLVETYQNYFGEGTLIDANDLPKRWEGTKHNNREKQNLVVICSLPLNQ